MIYYLIIILFFAASGICNSIMDTLDHHQSTSIFSKFKNQMWWNFHQGWRNKYIDRDPKKGRVKLFNTNINKPVQLTDAWHFFKMWMIIFGATSITLAASSPYTLYLVNFGNDWNYLLNSIIHMVILGLAWNLPFSLFYDKIWIMKENH